MFTVTHLAALCAKEDYELPGLSERFKDDPKERRIHVGRIMKAVLGEGDRREWEGYRIVKTVVPVLTQANNTDQQTRYTVSKIECCVVG